MHMKTIPIPYGRDYLNLHISEENLIEEIYAKTDEYVPEKSETELIRDALHTPIGTPPLVDLAKGKNRVVIITSDHTRAVPSKITLPILLNEIRQGSPSADITILIATGLHRATTVQEQRQMFGDEIVDHEKIIVHNAFAPDGFADLGALPSGASCLVNQIAVDCDLLISEGFIEPHFFAGFSGGRKSVLPGICAARTVNQNHSYPAIAAPHAKAGVLNGNPIHLDMVEAAHRAKLAFILNVALNGKKKVIRAFAGDMEQAHQQGVRFVRDLAETPARTADIVITSNGGYPLDQNLYQAPKAAATAEACAGEDGIIILCASCLDGFGGNHFKEMIVDGSPEQIDRKLSEIAPDQTISEQWCVQIFARILKKHKMILVSTLPADTVRTANMISAESVDEALEIALNEKGRQASVLVIPDGVAVLAVSKEVQSDGNCPLGK